MRRPPPAKFRSAAPTPGMETFSLIQDFNHAVFFALVYVLTTFRATFSEFRIAETFTDIEALKFKQRIAQ